MYTIQEQLDLESIEFEINRTTETWIIKGEDKIRKYLLRGKYILEDVPIISA